MMRRYVSNKERLVCGYCQWEILPGRTFIMLDEDPEMTFGNRICLDEWLEKMDPETRATAAQMKAEKRVLVYDPSAAAT